jgi:hypothetical protein
MASGNDRKRIKREVSSDSDDQSNDHDTRSFFIKGYLQE